MDLCNRYSKQIIISINIFIAILVFVIFVFGIIWLVNERHYSLLDYILTRNGSLTLAIAAMILMALSLGCFAALSDNICLLALYGGILISVFVVLVSYSIYNFNYVKRTEESYPQVAHIIDNILQEALDKKKGNNTIKEFIDEIQLTYKCCGARGFLDYKKKPLYATCCANQKTLCTNPYTTGCARVLVEAVKTDLKINGFLCTIISIVALGGAVCVLVVSKRKLHILENAP